MAKSTIEKTGAGYGKPPEANKWKKGQSGNPSGKKKAEPPHLNLTAYLTGELLKPVLVTDNGKQVKIPLIQLLVRQFIFTAAKGKPKDIAIVLQLMIKLGVLNLGGMLDDDGDVFTEEDRRLIAIANEDTFGQ